MAKKKRTTVIFLILLPLLASGFAGAPLFFLGFDLRIVLTVIGLVFGITAYFGNHVKDYLTNKHIHVWVLCVKRSAQSERRISGIKEVLADKTSISVHVIRPEKADVSADTWSTADANWLRKAMLSAMADGADFLVIDSVHRVIEEVTGEILDAAESGRSVFLVGDVTFPSTRALDAFCIAKADPTVGGFEMGKALGRFLAERPRARGVLIARSFPLHERPRAAYASLALAESGEINRTSVFTADVQSDLERIKDEIAKICDDDKTDVIVACTTDVQLLALSKLLKTAYPEHSERLAFIGYDGTLDEHGDLLVESSPLRVLGTVDAKPSELGRLVGEEILRRIAGNSKHVGVVTSPEFRSLN